MTERYSRQVLFPGIGKNGQEALRNKHVLIIGAGALGAANAEMIVRAGVGRITIIDRDYVDFSNLQRQNLYTEQDAIDRIPKADAARKRLLSINSDIIIDSLTLDADADFFERFLSREVVDLIIDGTDNFDIRFIINDAAQKYEIPWVYGACVASGGLSLLVIPGKTPCLHCLMDTIPQAGATCDTAGIISPAVQMTASAQTAEALKWLTGNADALRGTVFSFDLWTNQFSSVDVARLKKPDCPSCGANPVYPFLSYEQSTKFAVLCGRDTVQIRPAGIDRRDLHLLSENVKKNADVTHQNAFLLSFKKEPYTVTAFKDGRVFIQGVSSVEESKKVYYRYFH
ncbi:ThiF family adenylyltransferase [Domibacillus aminovorans]|uniref:Thiamine biosynthesis protein MoeB n=1 Tax=Domibacillus aminovorans TaxID=29332 RepID=A0A177L5R3_9BACI|nr:ThiF family adenylyltransferase [Domibacillus aminovorans]OAH60595.1 thiamine biosynthesis protein MoeB [Domibacillus aminovorans]